MEFSRLDAALQRETALKKNQGNRNSRVFLCVIVSKQILH